MARIDLPGGGWAELRDIETITERERRPLMLKASRTNGDYQKLETLADDLLLMFVEDWSYGEVTAATIQDIPSLAYSKLMTSTPGMDDLTPEDWTRAMASREDRHWVYKREGLPCRVCGTHIVMEVMGARKLYWCPSCQA